MTRAKDISKILTDANISGTLDVTGETTLATHLNLGDNDKIKVGDGGDLEIYHDGTHSYISDVGTGPLRITTDGTGILLNKSTTESMGRFLTDGAVELYHDNSKRFETTSSGVTVTGSILPSADDTHDLGSSSKQWRDIFTGDINLNNTKTRDNEVDGTRGSWTIQEGEDDLFLINRLNDKKYKFKLEEM